MVLKHTCIHTRKCKATQHPFFVCLLCSPIMFFIGFIDPISARLGVLVWFYFYRNVFVPEMEQEQTPNKVQPEDTETIQTEQQDAKREFNTDSRGMDATVHDIDSKPRSVDLASSTNIDDQTASLGSFVHAAQEDNGTNQERQPVCQLYESHQPMGKNKNWILLVILMFYYWLAWKKASMFYASKKRTCRISFIYKNAGF